MISSSDDFSPRVTRQNNDNRFRKIATKVAIKIDEAVAKESTKRDKFQRLKQKVAISGDIA